WYFNSLSFQQASEEARARWNRESESLLLANQLPDGSWKVEKAGDLASAGSEAGGADKDLYRTCLATLILEAPVRYRFPAAAKQQGQE
ncbi:MAG TPA: hypothetical protein VHM91_19820, partial [Verrucomicrobiales bacterium]|nr:hypothetical protein [Verrucomicrobiales bacterium]